MALDLLIEPAVSTGIIAARVGIVDKDGVLAGGKASFTAEQAISAAVELLRLAGKTSGPGEAEFAAILANREFLDMDEVEQTVVVQNDETGHVLGTSHEIDDLIDWIAWAQDEPMLPDPADVFDALFQKIVWPKNWPDVEDPAWDGFSLTFWLGVVPGGVEVIGTATRP